MQWCYRWEVVGRVWIPEAFELNQNSLHVNLPSFCFSYVLSSESVTSERLEITDRVKNLISTFTYGSIYTIKRGAGGKVCKTTQWFSEFILLAWRLWLIQKLKRLMFWGLFLFHKWKLWFSYFWKVKDEYNARNYETVHRKKPHTLMWVLPTCC